MSRTRDDEIRRDQDETIVFDVWNRIEYHVGQDQPVPEYVRLYLKVVNANLQHLITNKVSNKNLGSALSAALLLPAPKGKPSVFVRASRRRLRTTLLRP